jgi:hypothetical protein
LVKLQYSFNIITTCLCTDDVYRYDDYHPIHVTFLHICIWRVATYSTHVTNLVTPWRWPGYMPETCVGGFYNEYKIHSASSSDWNLCVISIELHYVQLTPRQNSQPLTTLSWITVPHGIVNYELYSTFIVTDHSIDGTCGLSLLYISHCVPLGYVLTWRRIHSPPMYFQTSYVGFVRNQYFTNML